MARVLEFTRQWMSDRFTFGRPLDSYQALKHRFADLTVWSHAAQAATARESQRPRLHSADPILLDGTAGPLSREQPVAMAETILHECVFFDHQVDR